MSFRSEVTLTVVVLGEKEKAEVWKRAKVFARDLANPNADFYISPDQMKLEADDTEEFSRY